jgi:8-oxo-dGTP diphosphatase
MPATGPDPGCLSSGWKGVPLATENLRLRALRDDDAAALVELAGDWDVARWTALVPHPYEPAMAEAFIRAARGKVAAGTAYTLAIERVADGTFVGCIEVRPEGGEADLSYWIGKPFWNKGFATEAVRRLLRAVFLDLGLARVKAGVMAENHASARVLEKAGLTFEGIRVCGHGRCQSVPSRWFGLARDIWLARDAARPRVLVVAVALIDADGRVLLARRPEGKSMAGLWEFPGGKVKDGETPEAALLRELKEELAIDIGESCLAPLTFASHAYDDFQLLMPLYVCRTWKGTVAPREGQVLKWVRPERLVDYPMPPADAPLIVMLRDLL